MKLCTPHNKFCCEPCKVPEMRPMHEFEDVSRASAMDDLCDALAIPILNREAVVEAFIRAVATLPVDEG